MWGLEGSAHNVWFGLILPRPSSPSLPPLGFFFPPLSSVVSEAELKNYKYDHRLQCNSITFWWLGMLGFGVQRCSFARIHEARMYCDAVSNTWGLNFRYHLAFPALWWIFMRAHQPMVISKPHSFSSISNNLCRITPKKAELSPPPPLSLFLSLFTPHIY